MSCLGSKGLSWWSVSLESLTSVSGTVEPIARRVSPGSRLRFDMLNSVSILAKEHSTVHVDMSTKAGTSGVG